MTTLPIGTRVRFTRPCPGYVPPALVGYRAEVAERGRRGVFVRVATLPGHRNILHLPHAVAAECLEVEGDAHG